jgi:ferredoxin
MQDFRYLTNVSTLKLNPDVCVGCGMCTAVCPHGVFKMNEHKVEIEDYNGCMECGACATNCPVDAITVTPGVGCASYIIQSWIKGKENAACGGPACC